MSDKWEETKKAIHQSVADHLSGLDYILGGPENSHKWKPRDDASEGLKATAGQKDSGDKSADDDSARTGRWYDKED